MASKAKKTANARRPAGAKAGGGGGCLAQQELTDALSLVFFRLNPVASAVLNCYAAKPRNKGIMTGFRGNLCFGFHWNKGHCCAPYASGSAVEAKSCDRAKYPIIAVMSASPS